MSEPLDITGMIALTRGLIDRGAGDLRARAAILQAARSLLVHQAIDGTGGSPGDRLEAELSVFAADTRALLRDLLAVAPGEG